MAGQAHQSGLPPVRLLAVPRRDLHHARPAAGCAGGRPLRQLPRLSRRLPDRGVSRAVSARCAPLHFLSHHRAQGTDPARVALADGQPHLWLRRLPGGVPVEQIRARRPRDEARRAQRASGTAAGRARPPRRRRVPQAVREIAGEAHGARSVHAQCADRDRQFRRYRARPRGAAVADRSVGAGARRGGMGAEPTSAAGALRRAGGDPPRAGGGAARRAGVDGGAGAGGGLMSALVCLGLGYCARAYAAEFGARFDRIIGTTRSADRVAALGREGVRGRPVEMLLFDGASRELADAIARADALLISAAPTEGRDPVLTALAEEIVRAPRLTSLVYLSSLGVYGDSGGAWIDETAPTLAAQARRSGARIDAERNWRALGARRNLPVAILRLGGIYGPGQNGMVRLLRGTAQRVAKPGHVSNRIHVYDIAQAIDAAFAQRADGVFNLVDDEPASPSEQIAFAAQLLGIEPPTEIPYAEAHRVLSPLALSFYEGCIRARNDKLKSVLGVTLRYPTYREGLRTLHAAGDHLAVERPSAPA